MDDDKKRKIIIVEKTMELFKIRGVKNVTVLAICEELNITRSSFYYYFKSKEEVLDYYFLSTEIEIEDHLMPILASETNYDKFYRIFSIYMKRTTAWGPDIFGRIIDRYLQGKNMILSPEHIAMRDVYVALIRTAQEKKEIKNTEAPEKIVELIVVLSVGIAVEWCNQRGGFDYPQKLKEVIDSVLRPA
ncbi:MAG: TetR/AcrR family transcriptional regulator [Anaerovoracaceae bacterium]